MKSVEDGLFFDRERVKIAQAQKMGLKTYCARANKGLYYTQDQGRGPEEEKKMKGSEKQVAWAEEIKKGFSGKEENLIKAVQSKTRPEFAEKVAEAVGKISTIEDASWWIDNRTALEMHSGNYIDTGLKAAMGLVASAAKHLGMA